jgi:hypothetical protein
MALRVTHSARHDATRIAQLSRDQKRNIGSISKRHSDVGILPSLGQCAKKYRCTCQELVNDQDAQKRIRNNYVKTVKYAKNNDVGNLLLLNCIVPSQQTRAELVEESTVRNRFKYQVPRIDEEGNSNGCFDLCRASFLALFNFGCWRLSALQKRKVHPNECIKLKIQQKGHTRGFPNEVVKNLQAVLETEPRETSHYALTS